MRLEEKIKLVLNYAKSLEGTKYNKTINKKDLDKTPYPFYIDSVPSNSYIKKHGINCTGMVNLMRQKLGLSVPGRGPHEGGTPAWYHFLKTTGGLEKLDDTKNYPEGTLFFRRFRGMKDKGHIAVCYKRNKKPLYCTIIHSYYTHDPEKDGTLGLSILGESHFWDLGKDKGYYEFACLPKYWLN